jgi:hypothetical protein
MHTACPVRGSVAKRGEIEPAQANATGGQSGDGHIFGACFVKGVTAETRPR